MYRHVHYAGFGTLVGHEHGATVCDPADISLASAAGVPDQLDAVSLLFQRNCTTLSRPGMPLE